MNIDNIKLLLESQRKKSDQMGEEETYINILY